MSVTLPVTTISRSVGFIIPQDMMTDCSLQVGDRVVVTTTLAFRDGVEEPLHASLVGKICTVSKNYAGFVIEKKLAKALRIDVGTAISLSIAKKS